MTTPGAAVTPEQIRAGRAMLGWSARELAARAGVHLTTVQRAEHLGRCPRSQAPSLERIARALERAGVEFLPGDQCGPGVRLREGRR